MRPKLRIEVFATSVTYRGGSRIEHCARVVSIKNGKERWRQSETNVRKAHVERTAREVLGVSRPDVESGLCWRSVHGEIEHLVWTDLTGGRTKAAKR